MTNFKLTDGNGVEWVKLMSGVSVPTTARIHPLDRALYIHPDDLPKPKDPFEEMAEKAIDYGSLRVSFLNHEGAIQITVESSDGKTPRATASLIRDWFIAHARKIDADATERERKADREFLMNLMNDGPISGGRIHARMSQRLDEISKQ